MVSDCLRHATVDLPEDRWQAIGERPPNPDADLLQAGAAAVQDPIRDIADLLQRAGAHSGSLYHYFPGKQDVLIAVLDLYCAGIDEMLRPITKIGT